MIVLTQAKDGDRIDAERSMYPSYLEVRRGAQTFACGNHTASVYGYVVAGTAIGAIDGVGFDLKAGGFFSGPFVLNAALSEDALVVLIVRHGFRALVSVGRIETKGRLTYIDGCSDTLLICPPRLGDPCYNHLHFPPTIVQTQHTHPSIRFGIVAAGRGLAYGPGWEQPLEPGTVFLIEEGELHSFRTDRAMHLVDGVWHDEPTDAYGMDVIAFHPDSDFGPTDANHPMINRTYIGAGVGGAGGAGI